MSLFFPSGLHKTEVPVSVCQGCSLPGSLGKELFLCKKKKKKNRDDDLFLCFCSSMPPISWQHPNRELIHFPSADGSVVKTEPKEKDAELDLEDIRLY